METHNQKGGYGKSAESPLRKTNVGTSLNHPVLKTDRTLHARIPRTIVTQHGREGLHIYPFLQRQHRESVPQVVEVYPL